ncbi:MAG: AraC family transcriptional regulator, partial [Candidatus Hydrogenedentes bacterium]|nr:AraC family transcriptional regulator [Candidatus Hydrogenedentota bacterium]
MRSYASINFFTSSECGISPRFLLFTPCTTYWRLCNDHFRTNRQPKLLRQNGGPSVEQVARQAGFNSRTHFSSAFKDQLGISPAAFQKGQSA